MRADECSGPVPSNLVRRCPPTTLAILVSSAKGAGEAVAGVPVGQQHDEAALPQPLGLARGHKRVDRDLQAIFAQSLHRLVSVRLPLTQRVVPGRRTWAPLKKSPNCASQITSICGFSQLMPNSKPSTASSLSELLATSILPCGKATTRERTGHPRH